MPVEHLPQALRGPVERARDGLLTDATALVILGLGCITRGISYIDYVGADSSHPAEKWVSMTAWSIVWIAVGGLCFLTAPWHRSWLAAISVACGVSIHLLCALSFIWATYTGQMTRGWVSSIGYLMIVALVTWAVWRGVRTEIRVREVPVDGRDDHRGFISGLVLILVAKSKLSSDNGPNWQAYAERQAADLDTVNKDIKEVRGELKSLRTEVGTLRSELGTVKPKLIAAVRHIRAWRSVFPDHSSWPPLPAELHEDLDKPTN